MLRHLPMMDINGLPELRSNNSQGLPFLGSWSTRALGHARRKGGCLQRLGPRFKCAKVPGQNGAHSCCGTQTGGKSQRGHLTGSCAGPGEGAPFVGGSQPRETPMPGQPQGLSLLLLLLLFVSTGQIIALPIKKHLLCAPGAPHALVDSWSHTPQVDCEPQKVSPRRSSGPSSMLICAVKLIQ